MTAEHVCWKLGNSALWIYTLEHVVVCCPGKLKLVPTQDKIKHALSMMAESSSSRPPNLHRRGSLDSSQEFASMFSEDSKRPITVCQIFLVESVSFGIFFWQVHCRAVEQLSFDLEMVRVPGQEKKHLWEPTLQWLAVQTPGSEPVELIKERFECGSCGPCVCAQRPCVHCSRCKDATNIVLKHADSRGQAGEGWANRQSNGRAKKRANKIRPGKQPG